MPHAVVRFLVHSRAVLLGSIITACFLEPEPPPITTTASTGPPPSASSSSGSIPPDDSTGTGSFESTTGAPASGSSSSGGSSRGLDSSGGLDETSSTTGAGTHRACPAGALDPLSLPLSLQETTELQDDELQGSCGGGSSAPEIAYTFTAPTTDSYIFDTGGSSIDTVLYVLDGVCTSRELQCDDDSLAGSNAALVSLRIRAGQTVTVVVDSFALQSGAITLNVTTGSTNCPAQSIAGPLPQQRSDQTTIASDQFALSCGTANEADQGIAVIAPDDGIYRLDTAGSTFDTVLSVIDGTCGGAELACNNDEPGTFGGHSALTVPLVAGQIVTAIVEGYFGSTGTFELTVDRLPGECPDEHLGALAVPFILTGSTAGEDEASAGRCGGLGSPDFGYAWTAPDDGIYRFDVSASAFEAIVYLLDGTCSGAELACHGNLGAAAAVLNAGQTIVIVVDGDYASGDFELLVEETSDSGNCCTAQTRPGCEIPSIESCVCTVDLVCCGLQWDQICVDIATNSCNAVCP